MNATTVLREQILQALDPQLAAEGFRRRKGSQSYRRKVSAALTQAVHLNFGVYEHAGQVVVNPSVGARCDVLERALVAAGITSADASRERVTVARPLAPAPYEADLASGADPVVRAIWADWQAVGRQHLQELSTLEGVVALFASEEPRDWGFADRGMRARLLVLGLQALNRRAEAVERLAELERTLVGRDQILPGFDAFASWFRAHGVRGEIASGAG